MHVIISPYQKTRHGDLMKHMLNGQSSPLSSVSGHREMAGNELFVIFDEWSNLLELRLIMAHLDSDVEPDAYYVQLHEHDYV